MLPWVMMAWTRSWQTTVTWTDQHLPGLSCPDGCSLSTPVFVSPSVGFMKANPGPFYATHDGGATWTQLKLPSQVGVPDFLDDLHWFGWGAGRLWTTSDGGRTWRTIRPNVGLSSAALDFVSPRVRFALRSSTRYLLRTNDGGRTWHTIPGFTRSLRKPRMARPRCFPIDERWPEPYCPHRRPLGPSGSGGLHFRGPRPLTGVRRDTRKDHG